MYDKIFSKIYEEYGWKNFSLTMGQAILEYFKINNISISSHLDLCCGVGTLCDYFYKMNIKTKGVDLSKDMIKLAKEKNQDIDFCVENVLFYKDDKTYDLITLTCDSINHFIKDNDLTILFSNISKLVNKNGYLIFDMCDINKLELNKEIVSDRGKGVKAHYYITKRKDLVNTNIVVKKNNKFIFETNIMEKIYNLKYIKKLLEENNFKVIKAEDKILNERYKINDKIYVICQKI